MNNEQSYYTLVLEAGSLCQAGLSFSRATAGVGGCWGCDSVGALLLCVRRCEATIWHLNDAGLVDDASAAATLLHDSNDPGLLSVAQ